MCTSKAGHNAAFYFLRMVLNKKGKRQQREGTLQTHKSHMVDGELAMWDCHEILRS